MSRGGWGTVTFDGARLAALHDAIMMRIFIVEVTQLSEKSIKLVNVHLEAMAGLVRGGAPNGSIDLPGGVRLVREYDTIILTLEGRDTPIKFVEEFRIPGVTRIEEIGLHCEATLLEEAPFSITSDGQRTAYFDYDALTLPLVIRSFTPGDRLVPLGMRGHKKVKDLFIDMKVPRSQRQITPLLVSGDEILWVAGVRQSEAGKVVETTKRVLKVSCESS